MFASISTPESLGMTLPASASAVRITLVIDPDTGDVVGSVRHALPADADAIVFSARRAAEVLARSPSHQRAARLESVAAIVSRDCDAFANLIAREGIKTLREARAEVDRCITTFQLSAEEAKRIAGGVIPFDQVARGEGRWGM